MKIEKLTGLGFCTIVIFIAGFVCETPKSLYLTGNILALEVKSLKDNIIISENSHLLSSKDCSVFNHVIHLFITRKRSKETSINFFFRLFGEKTATAPSCFVLVLHLQDDNEPHIPAHFHVTLDASDISNKENHFVVLFDSPWVPSSNDSIISIERPQQKWGTSVQNGIDSFIDYRQVISNTSLYLDSRQLTETPGNNFQVMLRLDLKAIFSLLRQKPATKIRQPVLQIDGTETRNGSSYVAERMTSFIQKQHSTDDASHNLKVFVRNFDNKTKFDWRINEQWQEQPTGQNWWLFLPPRAVSSADRAVQVHLQASALNKGQQHRLLIGVPHEVRVNVDMRELQAPFHVIFYCADGQEKRCAMWITSEESAALVTTEIRVYQNISSMGNEEGHIFAPTFMNMIDKQPYNTTSNTKWENTCVVIVEKFANVVRLRLGAPATRSELVRWIRKDAFCTEHLLLNLNRMRTHLNNGLYLLSFSKKLVMLGNHDVHSLTLSRTSNQSVLLLSDVHLGIYFSGFFEFLHNQLLNRITCPFEFRNDNAIMKLQLRFWQNEQLQFVHPISVEQCNWNTKTAGLGSALPSTHITLRSSELGAHIDVMNDGDFGERLQVYETLHRITTLQRYLMRVSPKHQGLHLGLMVFSCAWRCDFHSSKDEVTLLSTSCARDERLDVVAYVLRDSFYHITLPKAAALCSRVIIRCAYTLCAYPPTVHFSLNGRQLPRCLSTDNLCNMTSVNVEKTYRASVLYHDSLPLMITDRAFLNYQMEDSVIPAKSCQFFANFIQTKELRIDMMPIILIVMSAFFMGVIFMIVLCICIKK